MVAIVVMVTIMNNMVNMITTVLVAKLTERHIPLFQLFTIQYMLTCLMLLLEISHVLKPDALDQQIISAKIT